MSKVKQLPVTSAQIEKVKKSAPKLEKVSFHLKFNTHTWLGSHEAYDQQSPKSEQKHSIRNI